MNAILYQRDCYAKSFGKLLLQGRSYFIIWPVTIPSTWRLEDGLVIESFIADDWTINANDLCYLL